MKKTDRELGMGQRIARRDLLHGLGAAAAASFVPGRALAEQVLAAEQQGALYYPPALTGLRGNHAGSFDVAHELAREGRTDWGPVLEPDAQAYDLVVVGAGISGLAAAHFYLQQQPGARVLLLDNHDDFGGHAQRNEFTLDGQTILGYAGSQSLSEPSFYPPLVKQFIRDLGIDVDRLGNAYDQAFFRRHGLAPVVHFSRESWGQHALARQELGPLRYLPMAPGQTPEEAVAAMPISPAARAQMLHLLTVDENQLGMSEEEEEAYLYEISYRTFLERHLGITEPEVFDILRDLALDFTGGIEDISADDAMNWAGLPGSGATGYARYEDDEPYIHHFPDGNATVARLLVRGMIPAVAPGNSAEDVVGARFDYSQLDQADWPVRMRLNSTVVRVRHEGTPAQAEQVQVTYVQGGQAYRVRARHCVLACFNSIIPSLCPELPAGQREALAMPVRAPILYTNVLLRNWRAFAELGIGGAVSSGSYYPKLMLDFPVSYGGQQFPDDPDQPMIVHMERFPHRDREGLPVREQRRLGRYELLATPFSTMERATRAQLADLLTGTDFDPARDIAAITVNRWAHGYADGYWSFGDPWLGGRNDERRPHVRGRKTFGRIAIANSDAGGRAMLEEAVLQAHRAVQELPV